MKVLKHRSSRIAAIVVFILGSMPWTLTTTAYAGLPSCPAADGIQVAGVWTPDSSHRAAGIEAPIQLRTDAQLCNTGGSPFDTSSAWIGIEPSAENQVTQIGWLKLITDSSGDSTTCRFYEVYGGPSDTGGPLPYDCGSDAGGTSVWFQITTVALESGSLYYIYDCGTGGGYSPCSLKLEAAVYSGVGVALMSSESHYACQDTMMGGPSNRVNFGQTLYPTQSQNSVGGTWATRTVNAGESSSACSADYKSSVTNTITQTWDSRN